MSLRADLERLSDKHWKNEQVKIKPNVKAHALYKSLGFEKLDEMDGDDFVFGL